MSPPGRPRSFDRDAALKLAMELFWERGYEGVSLSELTEHLGINKPSLYAAFGCKEALFLEAIELYTQSAGQATQRALREQPTARAAVEAMLRNNACTYGAPGRPRGCMVVLAATVGSSENEGVRASLALIRRKGREMIVRRVQRGVSEGDLNEGVDPERVASFYNTVLAGLSVQARDGASVQSMNRIIDDAMALWEVVTTPGPTKAGGSAREPKKSEAAAPKQRRNKSPQ